MLKKIKSAKRIFTYDKPFFWVEDRARYFAFRRPGMSYLNYDEELLDIEGCLENLKAYIEYFKDICSSEK